MGIIFCVISLSCFRCGGDGGRIYKFGLSVKPRKMMVMVVSHLEHILTSDASTLNHHGSSASAIAQGILSAIAQGILICNGLLNMT